MHASSGRLVIAGDGTLHDVQTSTDLGVPLWESRPYFYDVADGVTVVGGANGDYVAAGPDHLVFRFGVEDPIAVADDHARNPHGVAMRGGHAFVVGEQIVRALEHPHAGLHLGRAADTALEHLAAARTREMTLRTSS